MSPAPTVHSGRPGRPTLEVGRGEFRSSVLGDINGVSVRPPARRGEGVRAPLQWGHGTGQGHRSRSSCQRSDANWEVLPGPSPRPGSPSASPLTPTPDRTGSETRGMFWCRGLGTTTGRTRKSRQEWTERWRWGSIWVSEGLPKLREEVDGELGGRGPGWRRRTQGDEGVIEGRRNVRGPGWKVDTEVRRWERDCEPRRSVRVRTGTAGWVEKGFQ